MHSYGPGFSRQIGEQKLDEISPQPESYAHKERTDPTQRRFIERGGPISFGHRHGHVVDVVSFTQLLDTEPQMYYVVALDEHTAAYLEQVPNTPNNHDCFISHVLINVSNV